MAEEIRELSIEDLVGKIEAVDRCPKCNNPHFHGLTLAGILNRICANCRNIYKELDVPPIEK